MALPAKKFEAEDSMEARIARLEAHTEHIQSDVQDLRLGMKELRQGTKELSDKLDAKTSELHGKIDTATKDLHQKIDTKFAEVQKAFESMKLGRVWDRVWMLLAMGALLGVMARGFKWI